MFRSVSDVSPFLAMDAAGTKTDYHPFLSRTVTVLNITSFCLSYLRRTRRRSRPAGNPGRRISELRWRPGQTAALEAGLREHASTLRMQTGDQRRTLLADRLARTDRTPP